MYLSRPEPTWTARILGSARTLAAIVLTALLASALTVRWSDAAATGATPVTLTQGMLVASVPVTIQGEVVGAGDGLIAVLESGAASPVAFPVADTASVLRAGEAVPLDTLRVGDSVSLTIDGLTGEVQRLHAAPAQQATIMPRVSGHAAFLAAIGLIAGATALAILNLDRLPALNLRLPAARTLHAHPAR